MDLVGRSLVWVLLLLATAGGAGISSLDDVSLPSSDRIRFKGRRVGRGILGILLLVVEAAVPTPFSSLDIALMSSSDAPCRWWWCCGIDDEVAEDEAGGRGLLARRRPLDSAADSSCDVGRGTRALLDLLVRRSLLLDLESLFPEASADAWNWLLSSSK